MYDFGEQRCPCCRKHTKTTLGPAMNLTAEGWDNLLYPNRAAQLAKEGICPWCGRRTTIVAKVLLARFAPHQNAVSRAVGM